MSEGSESAVGAPVEPDEVRGIETANGGSAPRWLLGPSLWVGGVLTWAYVVMGIFTTTRLGPKELPLGEGAAVVWVMAAAGTAGYFAVRRSLAVTNGGAVAPRTAGIALGALALWVVLLMSAVVVGQVAGDGPVSLLLSLGSAAIIWRGRILTNRGRGGLEEPRLVRTVCWIGAALVTALALLVQ